MADIPVLFPAEFATASAVAYASESGDAVLVRDSAPLPVTLKGPAAVPAAIVGTAGDSTLVGPFVPAPCAPVVLQLTGEWVGLATLQRSTDGGATRVGCTAGGMSWGVFTGNACEPVWIEQEAGAELYLQIDLEFGSLSYRVSQ